MAPVICITEDQHKKEGPVIEEIERDGTKIMRVVTNVTGCTADDITVRPQDKTLVIYKADNVLMTLELPESPDPFAIEAEISEEGVLIVEAPMVC